MSHTPFPHISEFNTLFSFFQTRDFIHKRDGFLVDNPKVGPTLEEAYWRPGNAEPFLGLVEALTGEPLSGAAWVALLEKDTDLLINQERAAYRMGLAEEDLGGEVDLDMHIEIVDGDEKIADTERDGGFLGACAKFESYLRGRFGLPESSVPKEACEEQASRRRLRIVDDADQLDGIGVLGGTIAPSWEERWQARFSCWFVALPIPTQSQLGACMGALALHVGSKLDAAWRAAGGALGAPANLQGAQPAEVGCEWLADGAELNLPAFPTFPQDVHFQLPPIPRLLPSLQHVQSMAGQGETPVTTTETHASAWSALGAGAATGASAAALAVLVALRFQRKRHVQSLASPPSAVRFSH